MKVAVVSDTHGAKRQMRQLMDALPRVGAFCFLGDREADGDLLYELLRERQPDALFIAVCGNNDFVSTLPTTMEVPLSGVKTLITHGHPFRVKATLLPLQLRAKERECGLALFGHTHAFLDEDADGVRLVNPGALCAGSWALLDVGPDGIAVQRRDV